MQAKNEEAIFSAAIEFEDQTERDACVARLCGDNTELRSSVEALLRAHDSRCLLDVPVLGHGDIPQRTRSEEGCGTVVGRYKLLEKIGEGGMAVVYMAEQTEPIRRKVALKIIKLGMDTKQVIARFEAERQALAMMDHANIARVFDAGTTETGRPYFVMELVTGVSITEYCDANKLDAKARLALFIQVCNAIQHAHQKGIIHRDIKPSNVMVTMHDGKPVPKVIDFGIAKATNQRFTEKTLYTRYAQIIGTPAYMSPEQAELSDVDVDTRSDIYSLGVLLYELLTGTTPFGERELREAGYLEMQRVIREEEPTRPSTKLNTLGDGLTEVAKRRSCSPDLLRKTLRGDLDWIVMKALEKDRTRRYDSTSQLLSDVERHLRCEPVSASPPSTWYLTRRFIQRHATLVGATTAVLTAILMGLVASIALYLRAERAHAETQAVTDFLVNDVLASVYPENAKGQEVTLRYLLETASPSLEDKFVDGALAEARIRDAIGLTYQKMGDYSAAEPHLERALKIRLRDLGEDDPATLASLDHLGKLRESQGQYAEAEPLLVRALKARQRVLGRDDSDTLQSMVNLGWLYMVEARFDEGLILARDAYRMAGHVLGEEHPVTLAAAGSLALGYLSKLQNEEAEAVGPKAYQISRRVLGPEHETTLVLMNACVWLDERHSEYDAGIELGEQALEIGQHVFGRDHQATILAMSNLGSLYCLQGKYEEAAPLLTESVQRARGLLGEEHASTQFFTFRLVQLYGAQGQYDLYDPLLFKLLEGSLRTHGARHPQTGYIRYWLRMRAEQLEAQAEDQRSAGDYIAAESTLTKAQEIRQALMRSLQTGETPKQ